MLSCNGGGVKVFKARMTNNEEERMKKHDKAMTVNNALKAHDFIYRHAILALSI